MAHSMARTAVADNDHPQHLLQELINTGTLDLPILPETSVKLLGMCNSPDCSSSELASTVCRDQSIATHVLRIANSAMYCSSGAPIVSLQQALARLGIQRIREIILIVSCKGRVFQVERFETEVRSSFRQSLGAAAFAQEIARSCRLNVEDAFLSGLLHDIGCPVLLQAIADLERRRGIALNRSDVLEAIEGFRVSVGSNLIRSWNLPERVANAVGQQTIAEAAHGSTDAKILCLAIDITTRLLQPDATDVDAICDHPMVAQLNIYPDQLSSILNKHEEILDWIKSAQ